jgi:hypothetical protein
MVNQKIRLSMKEEQGILQLRIERSYEKGLRLAALVAGCSRGKKGNITDALRGIAQGTYRLVKVSENIDGEAEERIYSLIESQKCFNLTYKKITSGEIDIIDVSHAKISLDASGEYLLLVHSSRENPAEIFNLKHNHCFEFSQIVFAEDDESSPWSVDLSRLKVEFWIAGNRNYKKHPDDLSIRPGLHKNLSGVKITRSIVNSEIFIKEIISYGSDCYLINPPILQSLIKTRLSESLSVYTT